MSEVSYEVRKDELKTYFDRTAKEKWVALTSNSPVSKIRETVRAGREEMRNTLLSWMPDDLRGARILDAGCGTGMLAMEAAKRGADVVAIDISPELVSEARSRVPTDLQNKLEFLSGDMTDPALGSFDYVVAMDSFIHYPQTSMINLIEGFGPRVNQKLLFTFAPKTPILSVMKSVGKLFPRNDRSPAIEPIAEQSLRKELSAKHSNGFPLHVERTHFVSTGFYKSTAMELAH